MVFLRPVIIYGPNDAYATTADRYHYLRGYVRDKNRQEMMDRLKPAKPGEIPVRGDRDPRRNDDPDVSTAPAAKPEKSPEPVSQANDTTPRASAEGDPENGPATE